MPGRVEAFFGYELTHIQFVYIKCLGLKFFPYCVLMWRSSLSIIMDRNVSLQSLLPVLQLVLNS